MRKKKISRNNPKSQNVRSDSLFCFVLFCFVLFLVALNSVFHLSHNSIPPHVFLMINYSLVNYIKSWNLKA
jgi:hypothetical protein